MTMWVDFKKLREDAVGPKQATEGAAGFDLTATSINLEAQYVEYGTGLAVAIPAGYVGLLFPRSSCSTKGVSLANSVGVIDSDYRGEVKLRYYTVSEFAGHYSIGERIGQLVILPRPQVTMLEVDELDETERGEGGFGSTGTS